jgi:hypothetical protein
MSLIYWDSYLEHRAWELGIILQKAGNDELTILYRETLSDIYNTITDLSINKIELPFIEVVYRDLDLIIVGLNSLQQGKSEKFPVLDRLIIAQKILEIIIVLFDDVQDMDPLNRLMQRNQVYADFKSALETVIWNWRTQSYSQQNTSDRVKKLLSEDSKNKSILDKLPKKNSDTSNNIHNNIQSFVRDQSLPAQGNIVVTNYESRRAGNPTVEARLAGDPTQEPPPPVKKKPKKPK